MTTVLTFEDEYVQMMQRIMDHGTEKQTRNAVTKSLFGEKLTINMRDSDAFPILQGRKMYPKGVLGEFAAMLRGPRSVQDFKDFGCNYWGQWADEDGALNVDYGNAWIDWNGINQIEEVVEKLKNNPNDRRMIVSGWRPDLIPSQSLPCCHILYQWRVADGYLDMIWYQRSVDMMVGLPSDIILAAVWNIMLANEVGLKPGSLHFMLGDVHLYEQHYNAFEEYKESVKDLPAMPVKYEIMSRPGKRLLDFSPLDIHIGKTDGPKINLEVIA